MTVTDTDAETAPGSAPYDGVLIFDGDCPFCSAAASALRHVEEIGAVPWSADEAQAFLATQFEEVPFALFLVDHTEGRIWAGRDAARELCDRAGMPVLVQDVVDDNYESLADAIRTVTGVDGDPDPYHGTYPLADPAHEPYAEMVAVAEKTHGVGR